MGVIPQDPPLPPLFKKLEQVGLLAWDLPTRLHNRLIKEPQEFSYLHLTSAGIAKHMLASLVFFNIGSGH